MASGTVVDSRPRKSRRAGEVFCRAVLDLVFPPTCVGCRTALEADGSASLSLALCRHCLDELALIDGPTCRQCGAPAPASLGAVQRCGRCLGKKLWFDETIALGRYTGRLRRTVLQMKRATGDAASVAVAELIWQRCADCLEAARPELAVPIPVHWRRHWWHGTNSAAVLAESLAWHMRIPFGGRVLRRRRHTPPQFGLPPGRRWANVRHAFSVKAGYPLEGMHVMLVDDVMTTGATCSEAAKMLKRAGADRVTAVVAARALVG